MNDKKRSAVTLAKGHPFVVGFEAPMVLKGESRFFKDWSVQWIDFSTSPRVEFFDDEDEARTFAGRLVSRFKNAPVVVTQDDICDCATLSESAEYWNDLLVSGWTP